MFKKFIIAALLAAPLCLMAQSPKLGYINSQEIFNVMPEKATAETTLKAKSDKYDSELKRLQEEFQRKMTDYEKQAEDPNTLQSIKDRHMQELQEDYQKIQNFQQTASQDLQKDQDALLAPITQKIQNAIQAVGAEGGYTFIYDMAVPCIVYTGTGAEDVSAKVKAKLGIK